MKLINQVSQTRRAAKLSVLALLFLTWVVVASSPARADTVFNVNANITNGPFTGTDVITGTITINTVTGQGDAVDITVTNDPSTTAFTGILGGTCSSPNCVFVFDNSFADFGDLALGNTVLYTGGPLGAASYIDLGSVLYNVTGTVAPASAATPEPNPLILVLSGVTGLLFIWYRRRLLPGR